MDNKDFSYIRRTNIYEKGKRIQEAAAKYLEEKKRQEKEQEEAMTLKENSDLMKGAMYSNSSSFLKNKERIKRLQESMTYTDRTIKNAMSNYITQIVESASLIDMEECEKIDPSFKNDTKKLIRSFLENAEINSNIKNKETLAIMEHIGRKMPMEKTGVLLNEDEVTAIILKGDPSSPEIEKAIKNLSDDVQGKVLKVVSAQQNIEKEIQTEFDKISKNLDPSLTEASNAPRIKKREDSIPLQQEEVPQEEAPAEEPEQMPEEEVPAQEPEEVPEEEIPEDQPMPGKSIRIEPDGTTMLGTQNAAVQMNADGSIDINIGESDSFSLMFENKQIDFKNSDVFRTSIFEDENLLALSEVFNEEKGFNQFKEYKKFAKVASPASHATVGFLLGGPIGALIGYLIAEGKNKVRDPKMELISKKAESDKIAQDLIKNIKTGIKEKVDKREIKDLIKQLRKRLEELDILSLNDISGAETVKESKIFVSEIPKTGLIETLAVNEGMKMISEGKEYNGEIALARAINYITVLETFDSLGLIDFNESKKKEIVKLGGGISK